MRAVMRVWVVLEQQRYRSLAIQCLAVSSPDHKFMKQSFVSFIFLLDCRVLTNYSTQQCSHVRVYSHTQCMVHVHT